jgi:hypothetical protein
MGEQLTFGANTSWVRGLERELAIKLAPHVGTEKAKELALSMARLAEKRAADAHVVPASEVSCGGCKTCVHVSEVTCLCRSCTEKTMVLIG